MLQELCRDSFFKACKNVSHPSLRIKGRDTPFINFYGTLDGFVRFDWSCIPLTKLDGRGRKGEAYRTRIKAWHYFNDISDSLRDRYFKDKWDGSVRDAMLAHGTFNVLFDDFKRYFDERRNAFMDKTKNELQARNIKLAATGKNPQSHGGVANLLKVLTKTMHDQGTSIYTIAKVQYAVCMQAGIYIPDEFLTDVLVAHDIVSGDS